RRRHSRDARRLPQRARANLGEALADLRREARHAAVVEPLGDQALLEALEAGHVIEHAADIALVLRGHFDLARHRDVADRPRIEALQVGVADLGPAEQLQQRRAAHARALETADFRGGFRAPTLDRLVALARDQPEPVAGRCEAKIRVVLTE